MLSTVSFSSALPWARFGRAFICHETRGLLFLTNRLIDIGHPRQSFVGFVFGYPKWSLLVNNDFSNMLTALSPLLVDDNRKSRLFLPSVEPEIANFCAHFTVFLGNNWLILLFIEGRR